MKKHLLFFAILLLSTATVKSQDLLFTSEFGGANSNGAIVKINPATGNSSIFTSLGGNPFTAANVIINSDQDWQFQQGGLTLGMDGKYYGVAFLPSGIVNLNMDHKTDRGIFYRFDPVTNKTQVLYSFTGAGEYNMADINHTAAYNENLGGPAYKVVEMSSGVFYGIAVLGGTNDVGGAWKFDVNTMTYKKIGEFSNQAFGIGYRPLSNLVHGDGGNLYGVLSKRNTNQPTLEDDGVLYRINTVTDQLEFVHDLTSTQSISVMLTYPTGDIVYIPQSNKFYGTKKSSADNLSFQFGGGIWSYNLNTGEVRSEWNIGYLETNILGSQVGGLVQGNDGKLYAFSKSGGANGFGTIIKYVPSSNTFSKVLDLTGPLYPHNSGFQVVGSKIYGSWEDDPTHPYYQMFSYDVLTGLLDNILPYTNGLPGYDKEVQFIVNVGKIIGRMTNGGTANAGSIFSYEIGSQVSTVLAENNSLEGRGMVGELTQVNDSTLVGYTGMGGSLPSQPGFSANQQHELGDLVQINTRTRAVTILPDAFKHTFFPASYNTDQINLKFNRPLLASNGKLYYSYIHLGYQGNVFRVSSYTMGSNTRADITAQDVTLADGYEAVGLTEVATGKILTCFRDSTYVWDFNTNTFTTRKFSHNSNTYGFYKGNFIKVSNGKIYGTTKVKGYNVNPPTPLGNAVIFSLDPVNFNFTVEYTFPTGIKNCNAGLREYNGKLYGSTNYGGTNNNGYLFSYTIATNTFAILYNFNRLTDGAGFEGEWTVLNNKLYATSYTGGASGFGTLVEFNPATNTLMVLKNLTMNDGRSFRGTPLPYAETPLAIGTTSINNVACHGNPTGMISISVSGGIPPYAIAWSNGQTTSLITNLYAGTYSVTVTDYLGLTAKKTFVVTEPPVLLATTSVNTVTCSGTSSGAVSASATGGVSPYTYLWNNGATTQIISGLPAGIYSVTVTDAHGCTGSASQVLTNYPLPAVFPSFGSGSYCEGGAGLNVGLTGSEQGVIYILYLNATQKAGIFGNGGMISFGMQTSAGSYSVVARNFTTGCSVMMTNIITINIIPLLPVSVSITSSTNPVVYGTPVTFTATPVNGGITPSYQWHVNGLNVGTNVSTYTYLPVDGDVVTCSLFSSENCASGNPAVSNTINMTVFGVPVTTLVTGIVGYGYVNCYNALQIITVAGGTTTFIVHDEGIATMIAGQRISYLPGTKVESGGQMHGYIAPNGPFCGAKSATFITTMENDTEADPFPENSSFTVYPNPTSDKIHIAFNGPVDKIELFNSMGQKMLELANSKTADLQKLSMGLYLIKITSKDQVFCSRIIKQ